MKKIVVVLVSLVVAVLIGAGNAFAQGKTHETSIPAPSLGPEWKLAFRGFGGSTLYLNTRMTHSSKDIVEVWTLYVPRGESRRKAVNFLKKVLTSKGKDPNNAERLWYKIELVKVDCKKHKIAIPEIDAYSFEKTVLDHRSSQHEEWYDIIPGSVDEEIEKYACKSEAFIPEPSLSSRWKLVTSDVGWSSFYVDKKRITPLPKGVVKVWYLWVPRGKMRRKMVDFLKERLTSKGKDPNNAERFWYECDLEKYNCKTHQAVTLEYIDYSFGGLVLYDKSYQHEEWYDIVPRSVDEDIEKYVCKEYKRRK